MSSHSQQPRGYADKAVQTGVHALLSANDDNSRSTESSPAFLWSGSRGTTPSDSESVFEDGPILVESAYIQQQGLEIPRIATPLASGLTGKPRIDYHRLPGGKPSGQSRIVSLPTPAPTTTDVRASVARQYRIVSMPERGIHPRLGATRDVSSTTQLSRSSYYSWNSTDISQPDRLRPCPSDLPQTPSPPSSPDSVMIVGNDSRVSGSFLNRPHEDENGWITWANSPPRPIPALHGPLSLPYARCPSGAEGTIVEGDDLSRKVWGLEADDSRGNSRSNLKPSPSLDFTKTTALLPTFPMASQENRGPPPAPMPARQRDSIIDLSRPLVFHDHSDPNDQKRTAKSHSKMDKPASTTYFGSSTPAGLAMYRNFPAAMNPTSARHDHPYATNGATSGTDAAKEGLRHTMGLGLDWQSLVGQPGSIDSLHLTRTSQSGQSNLNTAAPIFVPAGQTAHNITASQSGRPNSDIRRPTKHIGHAVMREHQIESKYELPTPPSTASPMWSPVFRQPSMAGRTPANVHPTAAMTLLQDPRIYSPQTPQADLDDYSQRLMRLIQQMSQGFDHSNSPMTGQLTGKHQTEFTLEQGHGTGQQHNHNNVAVYSPTTISSQGLAGMSPAQLQAPQTPNVQQQQPLVPSERRRNLSYQHPRSIPLARLIQRRLSSVTEEDMCGSNYDMSILKKLHANANFKQSSFPKEEDTSTVPINMANVSTSTIGLEDLPEEDFNARVRLPRNPNFRPADLEAGEDASEKENLEGGDSPENSYRKKPRYKKRVRTIQPTSSILT